MGFEQKGSLPCPHPIDLSIKPMELLYLYYELENICRMVTLILHLISNDGMITMRLISDNDEDD